jgi:ankyrin repeat protein
MDHKIPSLKNTITEDKLILAVETSDILTVDLAIQEGFDVNSQLAEKEEASLLHLAVTANQPVVIERLFQAGIDTTLLDLDGITAIEYAMLTNKVAVIDIFIQYDKLPDSPLLSSICRNDLGLFEYIISNRRSEDYFEEEDANNFSILNYLSALGRYELALCLKRYLDLSHLINAVSIGRSTPLILACQYSHENMVDFLLEEGADVRSKDHHNQDALYFSIKNGHLGITKLLLNHIEDPLAVLKKRRQSTFNYLLMTSRHAEVALFLIREYPTLLEINDLRSRLGLCHPLHLAALYGQSSVIEEILTRGALVDLTDKAGQTALSYTVHHDQVETFKLLCRHKANLEHTDKEGNTIFMKAAEMGANKIVRYCLGTFSIPLEIKNKKQETAFTLAAGQANPETLRLLITHQADINHVNVYGAGALHKAAFYANFRNVLYLIQTHKMSVEKQTKSGDFPLDVCLQGGGAKLLNRQHTALYLLAFMFNYDLKLGLRHLILLDAYSQRLIFHTEPSGADSKLRLVTKSSASLLNIRSNHRNQVGLADYTTDLLVCLQKNLFEYVLLFFIKNSVFSCLPREVLITNILCDVLGYITNNLLSFEDSYLLTGLFAHIEKQAHDVLRGYSPKKLIPLMQPTSDSENLDNLLTYVTLKPQIFSYAKIYQGLLRWIEVAGSKNINAILPKQCDSLFLHRTPLTAAIESGFEQLVGYCLQQGADPNQRDGMGQYPLHLVCYSGHQTMFSMLLPYNLNPSLQAKNEKGNYPLHEAILGGQKALTEMLIIYFYDKTKFFSALKPWEKFSILEQKNEFGETPFELAYITAQLDILECLLERHIDFYRYIGKSRHYLNLPSNPIELEDFKYIPSWVICNERKNLTLMRLFRIYQELQSFNSTENFKEIISATDTQKETSTIDVPSGFYALKFLVVQLLEHIMQVIPYPTTQFNLLQEFLIYFSFNYIIEGDNLENYVTVRRWLLSFQQAISTAEFFDVLNAFYPKKIDPKDESPLAPKTIFDKKTAAQIISKTLLSTDLMHEVLVLRLKNNYASFFMPQKPRDYSRVFALHISAACQLSDQLNETLDDVFLGLYENYRRFYYFQSAFGILYDFYSKFLEASAFNPDIHCLFALKNNQYFSTCKEFFDEIEDFCDDIFMLGEDIIHKTLKIKKANDYFESRSDHSNDSVNEDSNTSNSSSDEDGEALISKKNKPELRSCVTRLLTTLGQITLESSNAAKLDKKVIKGLINFGLMRKNDHTHERIVFPKPNNLNQDANYEFHR